MKIYNTMSREKEDFEPMHEKRVKLFVCGPTVYDDAHIGHARTYISFDIIKRYLEFKGYTVFYLQNITDIDDKIIIRALESSTDPKELALKFEKRYQEDMEALGVNGVNFFARATDHVTEIITQIETLIQKGFAYETESGVYFDESKFPNFGKLSRRNLEDLNVHRVNLDSSKKNPGDFALWKKKDQEPVWDSPWGPGRPGWHIEDTAITEEYFGPQYDIHGGGLDLIFPHHEAEIAQMEAASDKSPMVRYWMHTGFLNVSGEKMSKSLGNFITIRDLLEDYDPQIFRFFVLSTHYRSPIDFSEKTLEQAAKSLKRIQKTLEKLNELVGSSDGNDDAYFSGLLEDYQTKFFESMDNDFNTPEALAHIFNFVKELNKAFDDKKPSEKVLKDIISFFNEFGEIMGFDLAGKSDSGDISGELLDIIKDVRQKLREKKEWALSDDIRARLNDLGIDVED
ncbi:cysteine--tRNA ligase [Methanobacterium alkalithermotolerans]|uniref:Cysteine--tRNA ligase n=1 Tax=Methanobacterium alkalithermotolerans TaxID=2731220 RepID=A0A8T8KAT7_9EURY|nr:cysteine--tRNA ligase [Methanobacterium alkalithermotolerans]QUH22521.1 cysteine--tRNA ligase [Methanobacterium alkalithermotolerans]